MQRYETIRAEDPQTIQQGIEFASKIGYQGLIIRTPPGTDIHREDFAEISEDFNLVHAIELRPESKEQASGLMGQYRSECDLLVLRGASSPLNRFAVEHELIDVLSEPMIHGGDFNHVYAHAANENNVCIEFGLRPVLQTAGGSRVRHIQNLQKLYELVQDADAPYVVSGRASSPFELRGWRELNALCEHLFEDSEFFETGIKQWKKRADRNSVRHDDDFIEPGVRKEYRSDE